LKKLHKRRDEKIEGHKARLFGNGYNKEANYDKEFIPSRSPGYHKAHNLSSISTHAKNLSGRREIFLFEWSPLRRISVHQATIGTQGKKKRRLGGYQVKG